MKKIFTIYKDDLLSLTNNWAAAVIIMALLFLPSLYAWFNIKASWDPYGNTSNIPIAIVNKDKGAMIKGKHIYIGKEILSSLNRNKSLGWKFVTTSEAAKGVKSGKYFASITIPQDFSQKITTVLDDNPQKPELIYSVNEKINAVAPKITGKGASGLKEEISKSFVKTASGVIFSVFNRLGIELEKGLPDIEKMKIMIFWLNNHLNKLETIINKADSDLNQAEPIVTNLNSKLKKVETTLNQARDLSQNMNKFFEQNKDTFNTLVPTVRQHLLYMQQGAASIELLTASLLEDNIDNPEKKNALENTNTYLNSLIHSEILLQSLFKNLDQLQDTNNFIMEQASLSEIKEQSERLLQQIKKMQSLSSPSQEDISDANSLAKNVTSNIGKLLSKYEGELTPKLKNITAAAQYIPMSADKSIAQAQQKLPQIINIMNDAANGIKIGKRDLIFIKQHFPAVKKKISTLAGQIRDFEKSEDIREIIDLLRNDAKKESDFFAEPVLLQEKRLFPIPNYGSAMSPFFTTLSLWVGATLLISLIPVELTKLPNNYHPNHVYIGRLMTFISFALCQSIIVTIGDITVLKTYVVEKSYFIIFGLLISSFFMLIIFTLVSILGNVGKGLSIVLLVLQISGSGGTFPIQVMPEFFQKLNPYLPFTYAISLMREATAGILWSVVRRDLAVILAIMIITLLIGLILKGPIEKVSSKIRRKAKQSRLIH
ncbi:YhgE/Pip domain-containing protein [Bacillus rubiinfantis]|uniref:YhgE/Pip domain-containing protein n=1 Tax=Bacillus rubiinfantis TaxID=1499680 RepID=UPI0005A942DB|nr:YhgE/Pip domain-containing protein [Bacillus rubiinfantis]